MPAGKPTEYSQFSGPGKKYAKAKSAKKGTARKLSGAAAKKEQQQSQSRAGGVKRGASSVTSKDIPGIGRRGGMARAAGRAIEAQKQGRERRMKDIMQTIRHAQFTDSHQ